MSQEDWFEFGELKLTPPAGAEPAGGVFWAALGLIVPELPPALVPPGPLPVFPVAAIVVVVVVVVVVLLSVVVVVVVVELVVLVAPVPVFPVFPVPAAFAGGVAPPWVAAADEPATLTSVVVIPTTIVNAAAAAYQRRRGIGFPSIPPSPSAPRQGCVCRFPCEGETPTPYIRPAESGRILGPVFGPMCFRS